jgi:hypothetical protein
MIGIAKLLDTGLQLVDKFVETPEEKNTARMKMMELADKGDARALEAEVQLLLGQIEVNKIEAQSSSLWKGGWRPAVGWSCAVAFAYTYVLQPFFVLILVALDVGFDPNELPALDTTAMMPVLLGMLGLAGYRTYERKEGVIPKGK